MAEKESTLAIVIRTVDRATAGIRKISGALNSIGILAAPISLVGERLGALAKEAGLPKIVAGFKGLGEPIEQLGKRLLVIGGAGAAAVFAMHSLIKEFDDLGDKSEAMGVSADFLAQMRFAAERSGAEVEQLDGGIKSLSENLGQLRAGSGRMKKFLEEVSPALARQLKGAKSNEEAFTLLARAMSKIKDPAKRAALAAKTFGESDLGPLLARGADGIEELRKRFVELAGSQAEAVAIAGVTDDSLKDLSAAFHGVKAAIVVGLGPAFKQLVDELRAWFAENRGRIAEWARDFGQTLPERIHRFTEAFLGALDTAGKFIDKIGGVKTVAIAAAAVLAGPLVSAFVTLGAVMLATPFGAVLVALGAISAMVISVTSEIQKLREAMDTTHEAAMEDLGNLSRVLGLEEGSKKFRALHPEIAAGAAANRARFRAEHPDLAAAADDRARSLHEPPGSPFIRNLPRRDLGPLLSQFPGPNTTDAARVKVDFMNVPKGTRVTADPKGADLQLSVGYSMLAVP